MRKQQSPLCPETVNLVYAATGALNNEQEAKMLKHLQQCTSCQAARTLIVEEKTTDTFSGAIFPEWVKNAAYPPASAFAPPSGATADKPESG